MLHIRDGIWVQMDLADYTFVGSGMTFTRHDPTLFLARGSVVEFVNNMGHIHSRFNLEYQNTGTAYNDGVTNNGASSGTVRFEVPHDAPNTLYYQCTSHSGMDLERSQFTQQFDLINNKK